jgi:GPI-anchor transamidase subunit T
MNVCVSSPHEPSDAEPSLAQHYTLFPLSFGQLLREYAITELHLNLNAGRWNYENWGYPEELGVGTGAELWAWMADGGPMSCVFGSIYLKFVLSISCSVDERWSGLRNGLAGLICASLGSMDEIRTTKPALSFQPEGSLPDWNITHQIRHATLPSEHVCTENLTPFVKLLPCKSLSGIAMLLNPHKLLDADWHGMALHVLWDPVEGVTVKLSFQLVVDPLRTLAQRTECTFSLISRASVLTILADSYVVIIWHLRARHRARLSSCNE